MTTKTNARTIRAALIDPWARTVSIVQLEPGLAALYGALTGPGFPTADEFPTDPAAWGELERETIDVRSIDIRELGMRQDLICDDEGRLRDNQACFSIGGQLIAGRALIASHDDEGNTTSTTLTLEALTRPVQWLPFDTDYTPPAPVVIGFDSWDMLKFIQPTR
jgi:hypothetical protein